MDTRKIEELRNWDKNPRTITPERFEELKNRIRRFGQFKPLIITPDGEVIGGNMRLKAYREMGITDVAVSVVNPQTEAEKIEIALADNEEMGTYEDQALSDLLTPHKEEIDLGKYTIHLDDPLPLDELLNPVPDDSVLEEEPVETQQPAESATIECPNCHFVFKKD